MNLFSFTSFFKKKKNSLSLPDSIVIKKLREVCKNNHLSIYENITLYHHANSYTIPLIVVDPARGIFLFEHKEWSYNELKKTTVSKSTNQDSSNDGLAYEKTHNFIKRKFNELTHSDGVPVHNYLLMENLNSEEYTHLHDSFKELLPFQKIMFNDSTDENILKKLQNVGANNSSLNSEAKIMGNLLIQYSIFSKKRDLHLASKEQMDFIESDIKGISTLSGDAFSGKTSSVLLKAILEKLRNPEYKIIITAPTVLACDILKKKLLNIIEYAIIEVDITTIEIITPIALVNKHLSKLKKINLELVLHIDPLLMQKNINIADLIICDDSELLPLDFINYLMHIQSKSALLLVNEHEKDDENTYRFSREFRTKKIDVVFKKANQHAKTLQIISKLLRENPSDEVLVVCNNVSKKNLSEDLEHFVEEKASLLETNDNLQDHSTTKLTIAPYSQVSSINTECNILLDIEEAPLNEIEYAIELAENRSFIVYEDENQNIKKLKEMYA